MVLTWLKHKCNLMSLAIYLHDVHLSLFDTLSFASYTQPANHHLKQEIQLADLHLWIEYFYLVYKDLEIYLTGDAQDRPLQFKSYPPWNIAPENGWLEYYLLLLGWPFFRGHVSFREGKYWYWVKVYVFTAYLDFTKFCPVFNRTNPSREWQSNPFYNQLRLVVDPC